MFGRRSDGRRVRGIDPIVAFTPYIMPTRVDAQVNVRLNLDFDIMTNYIRKKRGEGHSITYMGLILAAYVRTVSQFPAINRFIMNKQLYARNHISISFVALKKGEGDSISESVVKLELSPNDTIFDICEKLDAVIDKSRSARDVNRTDTLARGLVLVPMLPNLIVMAAKLLDRYGLLPSVIHKASPFHTSMFISNMASIGMNYIYHHIYNFGTTGIFVSMGKTEQDIRVNSDGTCRSSRIMPVGVVIDERLCSGGVYSKAFGYLRMCLAHPELLEEKPEAIVEETSYRDPKGKGAQVNAYN